MQKLVSVYLDVSGYKSERSGIRFSNSDLHGRVDELLVEYLTDGWEVKSLTAMRGTETGGWVLVLLQRV
jgi:hypothetical protein